MQAVASEVCHGEGSFNDTCDCDAKCQVKGSALHINAQDIKKSIKPARVKSEIHTYCFW